MLRIRRPNMDRLGLHLQAYVIILGPKRMRNFHSSLQPIIVNQFTFEKEISLLNRTRNRLNGFARVELRLCQSSL